MKHVGLRTLFIGTHIALGLLVLLGLALGIQIFGGETFDLASLLYTAAVCVLVTGIAHVLLLSRWVLPSLERLLRTAHGDEYQAIPETGTGVLELAELEKALRFRVGSTTALVRSGREFLRSGEYQESVFKLEYGETGELVREFVTVLQAMQRHITEIVNGNLYAEIPDTLHNTPFGEGLQAMTTGLRNTMTRVENEVKSISLASARIAAMSQQSSRNADLETQAIESISSSSHQVADNLRGVMRDITCQTESLDSTFSDIEHLLSSIEEVNQHVESLSGTAEMTSNSISAIHEFMKEIDGHAHSLAEISETVSKEANDGVQAVGEVTEGIQTINEAVEDAATAIRRLGEESKRIGEILDAINGIAEQTNLLALNASIIAAQAGEHGRGFAVVAGEVRDLSERTRTSTQEISSIIHSLQAEVEHGSVAMKRCLSSVSQGVELANRSGEILKKITGSIQDVKEMASSLAEATVTQTQNSEQVNQATASMTQKLETVQSTASNQTENSTHLAEMANVLRNAAQHIEQSASVQLQETDHIVHAIKDNRKLLQRNARIIHQLAASAEGLGKLESNLAENVGQFFAAPVEFLPSDVKPGNPTIAFVYPNAPDFFQIIYQGIHDVASTHKFQSFAFHCQSSPVLQVECIHWLMRHDWIQGILVVPIDDHIGNWIVAVLAQKNIPVVAVDRSANNVPAAVLSDNWQGGVRAAELLCENTSEEGTILVCGARNIQSIFNRMEGFFKTVEEQHRHGAEVFSSSIDAKEAKQSILEGLELAPDAAGVFLTTKGLTLDYLELLQEGAIQKDRLLAVGYDTSPDIAAAISDGRLLGTIDQDTPQLGRIAAQELLNVIEQPKKDRSAEPHKIFVPVKIVTQESLT